MARESWAISACFRARLCSAMARDCSPRANATRPCSRQRFECRTGGTCSRSVSGERPSTVPACARSPCKRYDSASMTRTLSSSSLVSDEGVRSSGASSSMVVAACPRSSADACPGHHGLKRGVGHGASIPTGYLVSNRHNSFSDMKLTVGSRTDVGPRKMNQDHLGWWPELGLFVVADGMGGHNAGEVASHLAVETIRGFIAESADGSRHHLAVRPRGEELDRHESPDDGRAAGQPQDLPARARRVRD